MLIAQPRRSHLGKQKDVERELGLADLAHSTYFSSLTRGRHSEKRYKNASTELAAAGVYRVLGSETPRRVWWLAFSGKWGSLPRFNARECFHSFTAEEDGAGKKTIAVPLTAGKGGDEGGRASGVPRREGHCATGTATRASVVGMDQDSPKMLQRVNWVRSDAMQMILSTSTHGSFLNLVELSRFLDVPKEDLKQLRA